MGDRTRVVAALLVISSAAWGAGPSSAFEFVPDHLYSTSYFSRTILQYDPTGAFVDSLAVAPEDADELRGLAFGPDGLLYATAVRGSGFQVLALDEAGVVHARYPGDVYVRGNLSYGKLDLDGTYLYVTGQDRLTRFHRGDPSSGITIYTENQVFDVEAMGSGNVLVLSAYRLAEITPEGQLVRRIAPTTERFGDARGVEFDEVTGKIFVTHLGYSGFSFRLMRLNASTGALEDSVGFHYADDLFLTTTGDLLVGSRTEPPRIYDQDLQQLGQLEGGERMFVTQYDVAARRLAVAIDVRPGSELNVINPASAGLVPVAILGSEAFDVQEIDVPTLGFGPALARAVDGQGAFESANGDEWPDLVVRFRTRDAGIELGSEEACIEGHLLDGTPIFGCDALTTVPACGLGFEVLPILWPVFALRRSAACRRAVQPAAQ